MGISIGSIRPSTTIIYNNAPHIVVNCEHAKLGRGSAFCRVKLKNLKTGQTLECTLRDSDNIKQAVIEKKKLQYLYGRNEQYHFLNLETYEDLILHESNIEDKIIWLKDNSEFTGVFFENKLLDFELPPSIPLKVAEADPGIRGDTVKAGTKSAKLETGLRVNVPLFINVGEIISVDTRTKEYVGRA